MAKKLKPEEKPEPYHLRKAKVSYAGYNILTGTPIPISEHSIKLLSKRSRKLIPLVIDKTKSRSFARANPPQTI